MSLREVEKVFESRIGEVPEGLSDLKSKTLESFLTILENYGSKESKTEIDRKDFKKELDGLCKSLEENLCELSGENPKNGYLPQTKEYKAIRQMQDGITHARIYARRAYPERYR